MGNGRAEMFLFCSGLTLIDPLQLVMITCGKEDFD